MTTKLGLLISLVALVFLPLMGVSQAIYKIDNTIPVASDGVSTNGRIPLGTTTAKGDYKNVASGPVRGRRCLFINLPSHL